MARRGTKSFVLLAVVAVAASLAAPAGAARRPSRTGRAATAKAAVATAITVTPSTGLVTGQSVTVAGAGFVPPTPGTDMLVTECTSGPIATAQCGLLAATPATPDVAGSFSVQLTVYQLLRLINGTVVDCGTAPGGCMIMGFLSGDTPKSARAPIAFGAPPSEPTVIATPNTGLHHDQTVPLTGVSFPPNATLLLQECVSNDAVCPETFGGTTVVTDANGAFLTSVRVSRILERDGRRYDCATGVDPCGIRATIVAPLLRFATAPLEFDDAVPPPGVPGLVVVPPNDIPAVATVAAVATGMTPNAPVQFRYCVRDGAFASCGSPVPGVADDTGTSRVRISVARVVTEPNGTVHDCEDTATCSVEVHGGFAYEHASTFVFFDPTSPIPGRPSLELHDLSVTEGSDGGQTAAPMLITLSEPSSVPIDVVFAMAPVDPYNLNPGSGHLTIPAGVLEARLPFRVVADRSDEPDEFFSVGIGAPGYTVTRGEARLRIRDDDPAGAVGPPAAIVLDGNGMEGAPFAYAEVLLSHPSSQTVIVHYVTHHRSARAGSDYVRKDSRLIFRPGETRHVIRVAIVDDRVAEPKESFRIDLDRIENGIVADGAATVTIYDND